MEDGKILDQQAVRLPEDETGTSRVMLFNLRVRKIKSNVENILQLLWQREVDQERIAANQPNKVFTGDRDLDELESDGGETSPPRVPEFLMKKSKVQRANAARRKSLLEKAPKITRLQPKVCQIISDHEDVLAYDAAEYPPGTDKIPPFIVLDVAQEHRDKVHTVYKSYAEITICSPVNRRHMWDDSVNVPWETFVQFFKIFGMQWDPIAFLKRGYFHKEESMLINEYLSRCFFLDHENLQELALDLKRINFAQI